MFVENIVGDYVFPIKPNEFEKLKEISLKNKFEILEDSNTFYRKCLYSNKFSAIVFLNGEYDEEIKRTNLNYEKNLNILEELSEEIKFENLNLFYVNATCHEDFTHKFRIGLDKLPSAVVYDSYHKMFSTMSEEFNKENLKNLIADSFDRKIFFRLFDDPKMNFTQVFETNCANKKIKAKFIDFEKLDRIKSGQEDEDIEEEDNYVRKDL